MKNLLLLLLFAFFTSNLLTGQDEIRLIETEDEEQVEENEEVIYANVDVYEEKKVMFLGAKNALIAEFPEATDRFVEKSYKEFMNQFGKTKKVKKSKELGTEGISILAIGGTQPLSIYSKIEKSGSGSSLTLWAKKGIHFVSSEDEESYEATVDLIQDFAVKLKKDVVAVELEDEEKELKGLLTDMKKLKKDNENYHKEIEKAKEKIAKMEAAIIENDKEQEMTTAKISEQEEMVSGVRKKLNNITKNQ